MHLITAEGQIFPLAGGINTVGRGTENAITIPQVSVSRRHAQIRCDSTEVAVMDLNSANGTRLNGRPLAPSQWFLLAPGAMLQFGSASPCQFIAQPAAAVAAAVAFPTTGNPAAVRATAPPAFYPTSELLSGGYSSRQAEPFSALSSSAVPVPELRPQAGFDLLLRAVAVALDLRKLGIAGVASAVAALGAYVLASSVGGILPRSPLLAVLLALVAGVVVWLMVSLVNGALARWCLLELLGQRRPTVAGALAYSGANLPAVALTPLLLGILSVLVALVEAAVMQIGRIPTVGGIAVSLLLVPAVVVNLGLFGLLAASGWLVLPTIGDRGSGVGSTLAIVIKLARREPGQILIYGCLATVLTAVASLAVWLLVVGAVAITVPVISSALGIARSVSLLYGISGLASLFPGPGVGVLGLLGGGGQANGAGTDIATRLFQLGLALIIVLTSSLPMVISVSGACAVYLNVRHASGEGQT